MIIMFPFGPLSAKCKNTNKKEQEIERANKQTSLRKESTLLYAKMLIKEMLRSYLQVGHPHVTELWGSQ